MFCLILIKNIYFRYFGRISIQSKRSEMAMTHEPLNIIIPLSILIQFFCENIITRQNIANCLLSSSLNTFLSETHSKTISIIVKHISDPRILSQRQLPATLQNLSCWTLGSLSIPMPGIQLKLILRSLRLDRYTLRILNDG